MGTGLASVRGRATALVVSSLVMSSASSPSLPCRIGGLGGCATGIDSATSLTNRGVADRYPVRHSLTLVDIAIAYRDPGNDAWKRFW